MEIIFLAGLFPDNHKGEIIKNSKGVIQFAANNFQQALLKGFLENSVEVYLMNLPFIGSFPLFYKKIYSSSFPIKYSNVKGINLGFLNFPILKNLFRYIVAKKQLNLYLKDKDKDVAVVAYAVHTPFLSAVSSVKKKYPKLKTCIVVPDLPQYMSDSKNIFYLALKKIDSIFINRSMKSVDSFVFLSKYMVDYCAAENKQWVVIEGVYNDSHDNKRTVKAVAEEKIILYTGTLALRYGVLNLLEAFSRIKDENYRLWICGKGEGENEIKKRSQKDSRIKYFGQVLTDVVRRMQTEATVLINPRTNEGEYTKYSFPSKIIEYFASGTPTIMYKLNGIPEDYFDYCFTIDGETVDDLKKTIIKVCEMNNETLEAVGEKAQNFITEKKNAKFQSQKIIQMLSKL